MIVSWARVGVPTTEQGDLEWPSSRTGPGPRDSGLMSDLWRGAGPAVERFEDQALAYDRYRPRYPQAVFDDIVELAGLSSGSKVIEIGAGTGIATKPLVERNLDVTAIEPAASMAAIAQSNLAHRARFVIGRFEDFSADGPVQLVTAFNAWHWVEPEVAVDLVARLLEPGGSLALVWTEVIAWGQVPFEDHLTEIFGAPWTKREDHVAGSMQPIRRDARFGEFSVHRHPLERELDAATFVAVTQTYGGDRSAEQYESLEQIIDEDFGGSIRKKEEAVLYLTTRR